ncbi:MAG: hypothetical protein GXO26_00735 [Crenarchaeota archaeon]|nr:hypothetical protein [Thermoproteota archaeon]
MLNIIYVEPEDIFYPGVLLRTAYSALGDSLRKFLIISRRRINIGDLARYSRLPLRKFNEIVSIRNENVDMRPNIVISPVACKVDESVLREIEKLRNEEKLTILVDERGIIKNTDALFFNTGLFGHPAYEAVSLLYMLHIREIPKIFTEHFSYEVEEDIDYGELMYFMRNISTSILFVDNYPILDPRTIVYTLRHVFRNHGLFLDIANVSIELDYPNGRVVERILIDVYRYKSLEYVRSDEIKFDGHILDTLFISRRGRIIRLMLKIDPDRRRICLRDSICISSGESESPEEVLSLFLTNFKA